MSHVAALLACLEAEIDATAQFIDLLEEEAELLAANTALDALPALTQRKQAQADQLAALARTRMTHLPVVDEVSSIDNAYERSMAVAAQDDTLWQTWHTLLDLTDQAHSLNVRNGALIDVHLYHTQESLAALRATLGAGALYAADGKPRAMAHQGARSLAIGAC